MEETILAILALVGAEGQGIIRCAINLVIERHAGQMRLGGEPHVTHVLRVGLAVGKWAAQHAPKAFVNFVLVGILHDTLEDTPTTDQELASRFGLEVARAVRALSHVEEEELDAVYLARVAEGGQLAVAVKRHDKLDNLRSLAGAPAEFRAKKIAETRVAFSIWKQIDPDAIPLFEAAIAELEK